MANWFNKFREFMGGYDSSDNEAAVKKAEEATKAVKSTEEIGKEANSYAGAAAANQAGLAKKQAKAAAMQNGGGRLAAATSAAGAAQNASTEGFSNAANTGAQVATGQNAAKVGALSGESNAIANKAANRQNAINSHANRVTSLANTSISAAGSMLSDEKKKHTYIPKEDRH